MTVEDSYGKAVYTKSNFCEERELWVHPRICKLLLEETKSWILGLGSISTSNVAMWQP
jgi:hypothetical protein